MLRILIACPTRAAFGLGDLPDDLGGIERTSVSLATALAARGHRVTLSTRTDGRVVRDGVVNIPLGDVAAEPCDVLVSANDARVFDRAAPGSRKVLWLHNPLPWEKAIRRGQVGPIRRHRPAAVFVGTRAERAASRLYPFRRRAVVGHGLEPPFLAGRTDGPRRPVFVFASQRQRGLAALLSAWTAHGPAPDQARLAVYGTPAAATGLDEPGAARRGIVFHPRLGRAALAEAYAGAVATLCPGAHDETFCLAAAEAQAMGLPLLTLGIGALAERVRHGVDGLLCRSHPDLMDAARRLLAEPELWRQLHEGALLQREALTWERAAALWEALVLTE